MRDTVYEGSEPYVFISYSHKDGRELQEVTELLRDNGVRVWYDGGLCLGEDWNKSIATHLRNAAVCLFLLSRNSTSSEYVMNELNFANSYRIPIYTLILEDFTVPLDVELMIGRAQGIPITGDYGRQIMASLPIEVFADNPQKFEVVADYKHPLFEQGKLCSDRQGTKTYEGKHITLNYPCSIQVDIFREENEGEGKSIAIASGNIKHPLFPVIYDIVIKNGIARTYMEYGDAVFFDEFLKDHTLTEKTILEWIMLIVDGMEYLYKRNWTLRDFSRGSLVVISGERLMIYRLHNVYYGLVKLKEETRQYYFENILQEIAIILATLCTGNTPLLPLRMIQNNRFSRRFLSIVNLVIQKCSREYGRATYTDFQQIRLDLCKSRLTFTDSRFLEARSTKLQRYDKERERREVIFADPDFLDERRRAISSNKSIEEEFGFDGTALLSDFRENDDFYGNVDRKVWIRILIPTSGQVFEFRKSEIVVGRAASLCDWVCTQPTISRKHLKIRKKTEDTYEVTDLNTASGSYIAGAMVRRLKASESVEVKDWDQITIGSLTFQFIPTT